MSFRVRVRVAVTSRNIKAGIRVRIRLGGTVFVFSVKFAKQATYQRD